MISSARQAIACILLLWSTIIFAQSQPVSDKEPNGSVSGKITVKGDGVSGVTVGLISTQQRFPQARVQRVVTDEDGIYRFNNVKPGAYELAVSSLTYVTSGSGYARRALIVGKGETIENMDFNLVRGGVITGKVTDSEGRPVIEINVSISSAQFDHHSPVRPSLRTDDRGIYRAFGLSPGSYTVSAGQEEHSIFGDSFRRFEHRLAYHPAAADRSQATVIEVKEGSESTGVDITLGRSTVRYFASGRIVDGESGKPLAGVTYGVFKFAKHGFEGSRTGGATTNEQGEFKLEGLPPGGYAVIAEADGGTDLRVELQRFEVVDRDVKGLIVKATKGGAVSGVMIPEGTDWAPAKIDRWFLTAMVVTGNGFRESNRSVMIKPDGTFYIGGLQAGMLTFLVSSKDNLQITRLERDGTVLNNGIEIKDLEQVKGLRIFVGYAGGMVRGIVKLANGSPPPENLVSLILKKLGDGPTSGTIHGAHVDARGQFIAERLLPGTYEVTATLYPTINFEGPDSKLKKAIQQVVVTNDNIISVTITIPE